jgi:TRAP-type C4-dicarboxylate transport system permease small subunit
MNLIARTNRILSLLECLTSILAAIMLFSIMLIVTADVLLRYFFNSPLSWSYEMISSYLMVGLFFFSLSDTLANNGHVCVDILQNYFPARWRHAAEMVGYGCASVVFAGIVYMSAIQAFKSYQGSEVIAGAIAWPVWLSAIAVPIGAGLLLLRMMFRFLAHGVSVLTGNSAIALPPLSGTEEEE